MWRTESLEDKEPPAGNQADKIRGNQAMGIKNQAPTRKLRKAE